MIGKLQHFLGASPYITRLALKIRNQLQLIIGYHITAFSNFETNGERNILQYIVANSNIIIEVGANIGQYMGEVMAISQAKNKQLQIHTFEPAPSAFKILEENFKNFENVTCYNMALSKTIGKAIFYETETASETSSLIKRNQEKYHAQYEVEVNTLDNLFATMELIDFIKIDTEGNDFITLQGAENLIKQQKIRYIQFEYGDNWRFAGNTLIGCMNFLENYGYHVFLIRPDGLYTLNYLLWKEYYSFSNFLVCRPQELPAIKNMVKGVF